MDNFNKNDDLYDPNFSIDSDDTDKLDMYGVWIKKKKDNTEPEDIGFSQPVSDFDFETDQSNINFDDGLSFSDTFSHLDAVDEVLELDELSAPHTEEDSETVTLDESNNNTLNEDGFESLDLDDFFDNTSTGSEQMEEDTTFTEEEPIELGFTELGGDNTEYLDTDTPPAGLENFDEISLEDFEDIPTKEDTESINELETIEDFETVEDFDDVLGGTPSTAASAATNKTMQSFDIDVSADDDATKAQQFEEFSAQTVADDADISIFDTEDKSISLSAVPEPSAFFDDVEAVEQDLLSVHTEPDQHGAAAVPENTAVEQTVFSSHQSGAAQDKATELLMQIAHEISDLKAELNSLKEGLAAQSVAAQDASGKGASSHHQDHDSQDGGSSGFFSDDDTDETISLTGDELNNILITADFTEEKNTEEDNSADEYEIPDILPDNMASDIIEENVTDDAFEASIEETHEDGTVLVQTAGEELLDSDPVFNVEPTPITSLTEDLSYLDGDEAAADEQLEMIDETVPREEQALDNIEVPSFDLPMEQEIEVPEEIPEAEVQLDSEDDILDSNDMQMIHELQKNDENFTNPFDTSSELPELEAEAEIIEEPFIEEIAVPEFKTEEPVMAEPVDDIDDTPQEEAHDADEAYTGKQETLLQAATQIINGERGKTVSIPLELKNEIKSVLAYMDQLLEALPEKKIEEFAKSEYFETYKHLFEELGIS